MINKYFMSNIYLSVINMQTLPTETYNHIINNLTPYESFRLSQTCQYFFSNYSKNIINKINKRLLQIFGDQLPALKKMMQETGCVISGSFIIQCLIGETWKKSDIDFYVPIRDNWISVIDQGYKKTDVEDFMYYQMLYDGCKDCTYNDLDSSTIKWVRTYDSKQDGTRLDTKIQIICLDVDKNINAIYGFVTDTFDFDICKNIYYYDGKDNVRVYNLNNVLSRETQFKCSYLGETQVGKHAGNIESNVARYHKYVKRGIKFTNDINMDLLSQVKLSDEHITIIKNYTTSRTKVIMRKREVIYQVRGNIKVIEKMDARTKDDWNTPNYFTCSNASCLMYFFGISPTHEHLIICGSVTNWESQEFIIMR